MQKSAVIIGANGGIGKALCHRLEMRGDLISPITRNEWDVQSNNSPPSVSGAVDALIYLPGTITLKPFAQLSDADFVKDWEINFLGAMRAIRAYLPALKMSKAASITLVSTVAVESGFAYHTSISAAKGAIEGALRALAAELAPTIRVNGVAPSLTKTPLSEFLLNSEAKTEASAGRHPLKRIGEPDDIADAIIYLIDSTWVSGQILHIDGGISSLKMV
jgi:NAD(P)-dependent dehydrogenase (short-subunit alcohol dehydrogenase family)